MQELTQELLQAQQAKVGGVGPDGTVMTTTGSGKTHSCLCRAVRVTLFTWAEPQRQESTTQWLFTTLWWLCESLVPQDCS